MQENAYFIINMIIGYEKEYYGFYAFANNMTDTEYFTYKVLVNPCSPIGEPRMVGVRLGLNF